MEALNIMSRNPKKTYRWFTQGNDTGQPSYQVPDFETLFPVSGKGVWKENYIQKIASNFTEDFLLAMDTLTKRNSGILNPSNVNGFDIAFTGDNGDTHDVAYKMKFFADPDTGKLRCKFTVIDSIPERIQSERRSSQDAAFKKMGKLIQAYFSSALGWKQEDIPKVETEVKYMNNQLNGYCTSHAVDHILADNLLDPTSTEIHPKMPGRAVVSNESKSDSSNTVFFLRRVIDKLYQARLLLKLPEFEKLDAMQKVLFLQGLAQVSHGVKIDQVNLIEGRLHDHYETLADTQPIWKTMITKAKEMYRASPFYQQHIPNEDDFVEALIAHEIMTPARTDPSGSPMMIIDRRASPFYKSLTKVEESLQDSDMAEALKKPTYENLKAAVAKRKERLKTIMA
jgi:hypothetical protein